MNPPRSERFDDVYFSSDGLAEKRHVFLRGTRSPERWQGRSRFVIGELGFGTGLSMLATWHAARDHSGFIQFVSVEGYPLPRQEMHAALSPFGEVEEESRRLLELYPEDPPGPGVHHFDLSERFALTLWVGEVSDRLSEIDGAVDAWYLDGFAPAKNPDMWSGRVFGQLERISARGATLASYTAAGEVRRGLEAHRFEVSRVEGFGDKRHRIEARYRGRPRSTSPGSAVIVGSGIAGASLARSLRRRGVEALVLDGDSHRGASRNPRAVVSSRINRLDDAPSRFHVRAFEYATRLYRDLSGFDPVGVLRLAADDELRDRFQKGLEVGPLSHGPSRKVSAEEASEIANVALGSGGVWMPEGGVLHPFQLVPHLLDGTQLLDADVRAFDFEYDREREAVRVHTSAAHVLAETVLVANGAWAGKWLPELPIRASLGQLTRCRGGEVASRLRCVLSGHGYVSPEVDGEHIVGASYRRLDRLVSEPECTSENDLDNIARVEAWAPAIGRELVPSGARAAMRSLVPDHMPVVGRVGTLHTLCALGSRGFALAPLCAEVVASELTGTVVPMERASRAVISPERYVAG